MIGILSALNIGVYFLLCNIYRIDPKKYAIENRDRLRRIAFAISVFLAAVLCLLIYSSNHGNIKFTTRLILAGVGLLFAFIGNYMHNIKPNYFAGLRLPWTLENEENWRKTHLMAGKLWFGGGLLIAVLCLLFPFTVAIASFFAVMLLLIIIPCVYSYRLYKKQKAHWIRMACTSSCKEQVTCSLAQPGADELPRACLPFLPSSRHSCRQHDQ